MTHNDFYTKAQVLSLVDQMRRLNSRFKSRGGQNANRNFTKEIEFKITESRQPFIKQA
jgi:hypothetical protein